MPDHIAVSDRESSIVDCFRPLTGVGTSVTYSALRAYMAARGARPGRLLDIARELRAFGTVGHAVEVG